LGDRAVPEVGQNERWLRSPLFARKSDRRLGDPSLILVPMSDSSRRQVAWPVSCQGPMFRIDPSAPIARCFCDLPHMPVARIVLI